GLLGDKAELLSLDQTAAPGKIFLHQAHDGEDEAERAAAGVLRHIADGRVPVALADIDRSLTRRIRAQLASKGVAIRDENGWKLSTTRAAAQLMGLLRAAVWNAGSDAVLNWLKNAPAFDAPAVQALEKTLRRAGVREWQRWSQRESALTDATVQQANALRTPLQAARTLPQWLLALREVLVSSGQWAPLEADAAGAWMLQELYLTEAGQHDFAQSLAESALATRRLGLNEFTSWVNAVLEAASFKPAYPAQEQVVILPLSQLLARPFAALVLPGCDEQRLSPSPEPPGNWNAAQRVALGLPSRDELALAQRAAWQHALQTPHCDVLWRAGDDSGEPLLPSLLVQELRLQSAQQTGNAQPGTDARAARSITPQPVLPPQPQGQRLPVSKLSASAYEDLRRCPYRFFALRQLGLQQADEIDAELDKRDFGLWLHAVLRELHEALVLVPTNDAQERQRMADAAAQTATRAMGLQDGEFLPFAAAWPRVRDGYLEWLNGHEAEGNRFVAAESERALPLGSITLAGRLDRIDHDATGHYVLDYKTEAQGVTSERLKQPLEDTQLAFYAALLPDDCLRAAYVNVGEKSGSKTFEQRDIVAVRDAVIEGIQHDMGEISAGAPLPALGEGTVCDYCAARGLCRKDWWAT
ncbi:MAG: PD-(D/E)XK nuclease family protein, partial [Pseudomonadota bacterium]